MLLRQIGKSGIGFGDGVARIPFCLTYSFQAPRSGHTARSLSARCDPPATRFPDVVVAKISAQCRVWKVATSRISLVWSGSP